VSRLRNLPAPALVLLAMVLPWVNPFALGPSPPVVQALITVLSVALVLAVLAMPWELSNLPRVVAWGWLAAALLSSAMALVQYLGWSAHFWPWINTTVLGEAYANLRQRNQFATLCNIGLVSLMYLAGPGSSARSQRGLLLAVVLLSLGNAASSSRTGMLQLPLCLALAVLWGYWRNPQGRRVIVTAAVSYLLGAGLLPLLAGLDPLGSGILARLGGDAPRCSSRIALWANVLHLIGLHPWAGWGWGELDYAHFVTLYPGLRFCDILDNAHNLPLHLAVELGVPAAAVLCLGGLALMWRARPWAERDGARQLAWGVLAVVLLHSMLEYPLWYGPFQMAAGLSLAFLCLAPATLADVQNRLGRPHRGLLTLASTVMVACAAYVAWDYERISQIYLPPEDRLEDYRDDTLKKIQDSRVFRDQVVFAELTTTALTRNNAEHVRAMALDMLHFSPEARVVEKLVESATLLDRRDEAVFYLARFRAAFPQEYQNWSSTMRATAGSPVHQP
jgi:O-antigen ligase